MIEEQENFDSPQSSSEVHTLQGKSEAQEYPPLVDDNDVEEEKDLSLHHSQKLQRRQLTHTPMTTFLQDSPRQANIPTLLPNSQSSVFSSSSPRGNTQTLIGNKFYLLPKTPTTSPLKRKDETRNLTQQQMVEESDDLSSRPLIQDQPHNPTIIEIMKQMPETKQPPSNIPTPLKSFRPDDELRNLTSPPAWPYQEQEQDIWQQAFDHEQILASTGSHVFVDEKSSSSSIEWIPFRFASSALQFPDLQAYSSKLQDLSFHGRWCNMAAYMHAFIQDYGGKCAETFKLILTKLDNKDLQPFCDWFSHSPTEGLHVNKVENLRWSQVRNYQHYVLLRYNFAKVQISEAFLKLFSDTLTGVAFKDSLTFSLSSVLQSYGKNSQQPIHSTNSYDWMNEYSTALRLAQEGLGPEPSLTSLNPFRNQEEQRQRRKEEDTRKLHWLESHLLYQQDKSEQVTLSSSLTEELGLKTINIPNKSRRVFVLTIKRVYL